MHIPTCQTQDLEILTFQQALVPTNEDYDRTKWLYVPDYYADYRYLLGTRGENPLICIGINPSTAAPGDLDNTLKSVERIAAGNGYDSFLMFNVYAQRATRPEDMDQVCNAALHRENMAAFAYALSLSPAPAVWAASGTVIEQRCYLPQCVLDMVDIGEQYGARWFTAGARSKKGHPHRPLYLRKDSVLEPFDARAYCAGLSVSDKERMIYG